MHVTVTLMRVFKAPLTYNHIVAHIVTLTCSLMKAYLEWLPLFQYRLPVMNVHWVIEDIHGSELDNTKMKHVPSCLDGGEHCQWEEYRIPHLSHVDIFPFPVQLWNLSDDTI